LIIQNTNDMHLLVIIITVSSRELFNDWDPA
jgi:hypothetical protein